MEEELVRILFERALKITTAESCTGGLIAATLVNVAGVSDVFETGFITYSEETKMRILGVKRETLENIPCIVRKLPVRWLRVPQRLPEPMSHFPLRALPDLTEGHRTFL